jgi:hypothetical protein
MYVRIRTYFVRKRTVKQVDGFHFTSTYQHFTYLARTLFAS